MAYFVHDNINTETTAAFKKLSDAPLTVVMVAKNLYEILHLQTVANAVIG